MILSLRIVRTSFAALLAAMLGSCSLLFDDGPQSVAVIGELHRNPDRAPPPISLPDRLLVDATGQGLVSFSAEGQIEAGLAERWTVIDNGRSYIFRLRDARWGSGASVQAREVASILRGKINSGRLRPAMRGEFRMVRDIRAMTSRVIEIRLYQPQPHLLDLLAQPDVGIFRDGRGWGPWRAQWQGGTARLFAPPLAGTNADAGDEVAEEPQVLLWGSAAAPAVARFGAGELDAVFGGRFEDRPYLDAANIAGDRRLFDPVDGLFGLAVVEPRGLLATEAGRAAVAMAIDRAALVDAIGSPWTARTTIRSLRAGEVAAEGFYPDWIDLSAGERLTRARETVRGAEGGNVRLRVALPTGPGADMLFARLRADLGRADIGIVRVALGANADLRLVDETAPSDDVAWYVRRLSCRQGLLCDQEIDDLVRALDAGGTEAERRVAMSEAEAAVVRFGAFIPLASPLRWSLASPRSNAVRANIRGRHSLIRLRASPD